MRSFFAVLAVSVSIAACASASSPPPAEIKIEAEAQDTSAPAPSSAGEKCLALAGAVRERKAGEPEKIGVRHVLVKYKGAKRADNTVTRSREQACLRALEARDKVLAGSADFDAIVNEYSEEPGAKDRRGSLGTIGRGDLVKPFSDAAFELTIGQMSDVVESDFGFHLILRNE